MNRRRFMAEILAAGVAPSIVRADLLMKIVPVQTEVLRSVGQMWVVNPEGYGFASVFYNKFVGANKHEWETVVLDA